MIEHLELARRIAYRRPIPRHKLRSEIVSAAYWGLVKAAVNWRYGEFSGFAAKWIEKAITQEIKATDMVVGHRSHQPITWDQDSMAHLDRCTCADPLGTMIAKEERAWLRGAIKRLSPVRRKVIHEMLAGAPYTKQAESNRWKAVKQLRAML